MMAEHTSCDLVSVSIPTSPVFHEVSLLQIETFRLLSNQFSDKNGYKRQNEIGFPQRDVGAPGDTPNAVVAVS